MSAIEQTLNYKQHSTLIETEGQNTLQLCSTKNQNKNTAFFKGDLNSPMQAARCLRAISILVGARYFTPPAMLARILRESDPVVTVSRKMLRFEGFSACCSTYGRLDVLPNGFEASKIVPGTTNVDFQAEMRGILAKVRNDSSMSMSVRPDEFELVHDEATVIEKKVKLPLRWIKGFSEVQSSQNSMALAFKISRNEALRFFRQLPKGSTKHPAWIVAAGNGIRLSHREVACCVRIKGCERLAVLAEIVQYSNELSIYVDTQNTTSAWVLSFGDLRFTLVLSEETWRGFSGEGQLLKDIASSKSEQVLNKVKAALNWQESISVQELSLELKENESSIKVALNLLASRGLVGFDVYTNSYFHRVLPFDLSKIEDLNPRIKSAKRLISEGAVTVIENCPDSKKEYVFRGEVESSGVIHRVELSSSGDDKCTCPWFAKHQSDRGPCKHILALSISVDE